MGLAYCIPFHDKISFWCKELYSLEQIVIGWKPNLSLKIIIIIIVLVKKKNNGWFVSPWFWEAHGIPFLKTRNCNTTVYCSVELCKTIYMIVWERLWESEEEVQRVCYRLYLFIFVGLYNKRTSNFCVDLAHLGWTMLYLVSLL